MGLREQRLPSQRRQRSRHGHGHRDRRPGHLQLAAIPYVGPAAGATILPIKVLDANNQGTEFWLAEGIPVCRPRRGAGDEPSLDFARNYVPGAAMRDAIAAARDAAWWSSGPAATPDGACSIRPRFRRHLGGGVQARRQTDYAVTGLLEFGRGAGPGGPRRRHGPGRQSGRSLGRRPCPGLSLPDPLRTSPGGCSPARRRRRPT